MFTPDPARNRESARKLAELRPALACFGHGAPLRDPGKLAEFVAKLPRLSDGRRPVHPRERRAREPTEHARGPWDPRALHGGAPAALIARAFERMEPGAELPIARLGFEFLSRSPSRADGHDEIVRKGRRVQELTAELRAVSGGGAPGEELICRASALRIQAGSRGSARPRRRRGRRDPSRRRCPGRSRARS